MLRRLTVVLATVLVASGVGLPRAEASGSQAAALVNSSRAAHGLAPLQWHGALAGHAQWQAGQMAARGDVWHSSLSGVTSGWEALGENVGMGPSVGVIHDAFMRSSGHRANILGNYNYVGAGVATGSDGTVFVAVAFMRKPVPATTAASTSGGSGATAARASISTPPPRPTASFVLPPVPLLGVDFRLLIENPGAAATATVAVAGQGEEDLVERVQVGRGSKSLSLAELFGEPATTVGLSVSGPADLRITLQGVRGEDVMVERTPVEPAKRWALSGAALIWNPSGEVLSLRGLEGPRGGDLRPVTLALRPYELRTVSGLLLLGGSSEFLVTAPPPEVRTWPSHFATRLVR